LHETYHRIAAAPLLFRDRITHADGERAALFVIPSAVTVLQARTPENDSVWEKVAALHDKESKMELTDFGSPFRAQPFTRAFIAGT
jgi:hypothetical protein